MPCSARWVQTSDIHPLTKPSPFYPDRLAAARDTISKIVAIWVPVFSFVCLGFDHVVANMLFIPLAMMFGSPDITVGFYIWKSFIPAFLGNAVGALIIGIPYKFYYLNDPKVFQEAEVAATTDALEKGNSSTQSSGSSTPRDMAPDFVHRHIAHLQKTSRRDWRSNSVDTVVSPVKDV